VPFIAYWYIANYTVIPTEYMANLTAKCPPHTIARVFHERAFPYIGKTALGYFAYLGILTHHKLLTSNTTNQGTDLWRSLVRLGLSALLCSLFLWQLQFVDWSYPLFTLYLNKTVIPCGFSAFLLCSFMETLFEHMNLLNRDYSSSKQKYCIFVHQHSEGRGEDGSKRSKQYKSGGGAGGSGLGEALL